MKRICCTQHEIIFPLSDHHRSWKFLQCNRLNLRVVIIISLVTLKHQQGPSQELVALVSHCLNWGSAACRSYTSPSRYFLPQSTTSFDTLLASFKECGWCILNCESIVFDMQSLLILSQLGDVYNYIIFLCQFTHKATVCETVVPVVESCHRNIKYTDSLQLICGDILYFTPFFILVQFLERKFLVYFWDQKVSCDLGIE